MDPSDRRYVWRHRKWPCHAFDEGMQPNHRYGQECRVIARGRNGNTLVEFADGTRLVGVRYCVRALKE